MNLISQTGPEAPGLAHALMHAAADAAGHAVTHQMPGWVHPVLHLSLVWGPVALIAAALWLLLSALLRRQARRRLQVSPPPRIRGFEPGIYAYILRWTGREQARLMALGLLSMPVLYAALELPKIIVNNAIDADRFPVTLLGEPLDQLDYLFALCGLYLAAIIANGAVKYVLNLRRGRVGERLLRRLRLTVWRRWREGAGGPRRGEAIPLIAQEVEPIGGFAAEAFSLPVFQGGTFLTILVFMFVQDPVLGAAAVSLLPLQLVLIPRLQRRVNRLARARAAEIRRLGGELADQAEDGRGRDGIAAIGGSLRRIERIRRDLHREKFLMKALQNFLSALTPFFFYAIGGWLVIEGTLTLGALVAVLAAYKDFSAPLRELFRHYQGAQDVFVRYEDLLRHLAPQAAPTAGVGRG